MALGDDVERGIGVGVFQIEQAALNERLHRRHRQAQARRLHDRLHARVDEEIFEELVGVLERQAPAQDTPPARRASSGEACRRQIARWAAM